MFVFEVCNNILQGLSNKQLIIFRYSMIINKNKGVRMLHLMINLNNYNGLLIDKKNNQDFFFSGKFDILDKGEKNYSPCFV